MFPSGTRQESHQSQEGSKMVEKNDACCQDPVIIDQEEATCGKHEEIIIKPHAITYYYWSLLTMQVWDMGEASSGMLRDD